MLRIIGNNIRIGIHQKNKFVAQKELYGDGFVWYTRMLLKEYRPTLILGPIRCVFLIQRYKPWHKHHEMILYHSEPCAEQWRIFRTALHYCLYEKESFYAAQFECYECTGRFNLLL